MGGAGDGAARLTVFGGLRVPGQAFPDSTLRQPFAPVWTRTGMGGLDLRRGRMPKPVRVLVLGVLVGSTGIPCGGVETRTAAAQGAARR